MATERQFVCSRKHRSWVPVLLEALRQAATHSIPACPICGGPRALRLRFAFGLGAQVRWWNVERSLFPRRPITWQDHGHRVTHYPFLVLLRAADGDRAVWLPYWHQLRKGRAVRAKYGQWAPFIGIREFRHLVRAARI